MLVEGTNVGGRQFGGMRFGRSSKRGHAVSLCFLRTCVCTFDALVRARGPAKSWAEASEEDHAVELCDDCPFPIVGRPLLAAKNLDGALAVRSQPDVGPLPGIVKLPAGAGQRKQQR